MTEIIHAIIGKDGAVLQTIVWDGVTPWPAPQDAEKMAEAGFEVVKAPADMAITMDHVYDAKTKAFDWSDGAKAAQAEAALAQEVVLAALEASEALKP